MEILNIQEMTTIIQALGPNIAVIGIALGGGYYFLNYTGMGKFVGELFKSPEERAVEIKNAAVVLGGYVNRTIVPKVEQKIGAVKKAVGNKAQAIKTTVNGDTAEVQNFFDSTAHKAKTNVIAVEQVVSNNVADIHARVEQKATVAKTVLHETSSRLTSPFKSAATTLVTKERAVQDKVAGFFHHL
jgi:hypothetical protein